MTSTGPNAISNPREIQLGLAPPVHPPLAAFASPGPFEDLHARVKHLENDGGTTALRLGDFGVGFDLAPGKRRGQIARDGAEPRFGGHHDLPAGQYRQHRVVAYIPMHEADGSDGLQLGIGGEKVRQFLTGAHFLGGAGTGIVPLARIEIVDDEMDRPFLALDSTPGLRLDAVDDVAVDGIANGNEQAVLARRRLGRG